MQKNETGYFCEKCVKYYASAKSYGNHCRSYHTTRAKPKCSYCGNEFTRNDNLLQHIKLFHLNGDVTNPFTCPHCRKKTVTHRILARHIKKCPLNPDLNNPYKRLAEKFQDEKHKEHEKLDGNSKKHEDENHDGKKHEGVSKKDVSSSYGHKAVENLKILVDSCLKKNSLDNKDNCNPPPKKRKQGNAVASDVVQNKEMSHNVAIDCTECNITFLSQHDFQSHKSFCVAQT